MGPENELFALLQLSPEQQSLIRKGAISTGFADDLGSYVKYVLVTESQKLLGVISSWQSRYNLSKGDLSDTYASNK